MPKMKTNKSAAKRFRKTKTGKVKRGRAFAAHLATGKTSKRKRHLRKGLLVHSTDEGRILRLLPYM